jgi:hypothetical protein
VHGWFWENSCNVYSRTRLGAVGLQRLDETVVEVDEHTVLVMSSCPPLLRFRPPASAASSVLG